MDWTAQVDNYCERAGLGFWAEPVNALTNAAFLISAALVLFLLRGRPDTGARILVAILAAIGIGSFLFHTFATRWAAMLDVLPILVFILVYLHYATVRFFALPVWAGLVAVVLYVPYSGAVAAGVAALVGSLNGSVAYVPVPVLILLYAAALRQSTPRTAGGLATGAGLLALSLFFRTIDAQVCAGFPLGTHFLWHVLNGIMLGWMILVLHGHRRAAG